MEKDDARAFPDMKAEQNPVSMGEVTKQLKSREKTTRKTAKLIVRF